MQRVAVLAYFHGLNTRAGFPAVSAGAAVFPLLGAAYGIVSVVADLHHGHAVFFGQVKHIVFYAVIVHDSFAAGYALSVMDRPLIVELFQCSFLFDFAFRDKAHNLHGHFVVWQ